MLPRTEYLPAAGEDLAQWCHGSYVDGSRTRREVLRTSGASDAYHDWSQRISTDNGRTWSAPTPIPDVVLQRGDGGLVTYPNGHHFDPVLGISYEKIMRRLWPGQKVYTYDWNGHQHPFNDHTFLRENGTEVLLRYEDGPDFDPENPFDEAFCRTNRAYLGVGMAFSPDGTAYFPVVCRPGRRSLTTGGVVLMRRDPRSGQWRASEPQFIDPALSSRGLLEPDVARLRDGTLLVVIRGSDTPTTPGRKWFCVSTDGGKTLSPPQELRYADGSRFYSPSSIHSFIRSARTGRLYWIANIVPDPPQGNGPRYPLFVTTIDEERMAVCRDSLVCVDDRQAGEPEALQLSNFCILEDRDTLDIEIYLTRVGQNAAHFWQAPVYRYVFSPRE